MPAASARVLALEGLPNRWAGVGDECREALSARRPRRHRNRPRGHLRAGPWKAEFRPFLFEPFRHAEAGFRALARRIRSRTDGHEATRRAARRDDPGRQRRRRARRDVRPVPRGLPQWPPRSSADLREPAVTCRGGKAAPRRRTGDTGCAGSRSDRSRGCIPSGGGSTIQAGPGPARSYTTVEAHRRVSVARAVAAGRRSRTSRGRERGAPGGPFGRVAEHRSRASGVSCLRRTPRPAHPRAGGRARYPPERNSCGVRRGHSIVPAAAAERRNDRRAWAEHKFLLQEGVVPRVPAAVVAQVSRSARSRVGRWSPGK
jgi:hypothetical protein